VSASHHRCSRHDTADTNSRYPVERAFLFDKHIDHATYERQRNELRDAMTMVTIELENVRSNELDIEGLLRFSEDVLCDAARLWTDAAPEQKQRLQAALFPQGLRMRDGGFGTVVTSLAFKYFGGDSGSNSGMASPSGTDALCTAEAAGRIAA
jgi:hypothetical protein